MWEKRWFLYFIQKTTTLMCSYFRILFFPVQKVWFCTTKNFLLYELDLRWSFNWALEEKIKEKSREKRLLKRVKAIQFMKHAECLGLWKMEDKYFNWENLPRKQWLLKLDKLILLFHSLSFVSYSTQHLSFLIKVREFHYPEYKKKKKMLVTINIAK